MIQENQLIVLTKDGEVVVTTIDSFNSDNGTDYSLEDGYSISLRRARSWGRGIREWRDVLDTFRGMQFIEIEGDPEDGSLVAVAGRDYKANEPDWTREDEAWWRSTGGGESREEALAKVRLRLEELS